MALYVIVCYCVLEVRLCFSLFLKQKLEANQANSDILTCESVWKWLSISHPLFPVVFETIQTQNSECPLIVVESRHHR